MQNMRRGNDQKYQRFNQNNADLLLSVYELTARSSFQLGQRPRHQSHGRQIQDQALKESAVSPKKVPNSALSPTNSVSKPQQQSTLTQHSSVVGNRRNKKQQQLIIRQQQGNSQQHGVLSPRYQNLVGNMNSSSNQSFQNQIQILEANLLKMEKKAESRKVCIKKLYQLLEKNERELDLYRTGKKSFNSKNSMTVQNDQARGQSFGSKKGELSDILNTVYARKNGENPITQESMQNDPMENSNYFRDVFNQFNVELERDDTRSKGCSQCRINLTSQDLQLQLIDIISEKNNLEAQKQELSLMVQKLQQELHLKQDEINLKQEQLMEQNEHFGQIMMHHNIAVQHLSEKEKYIEENENIVEQLRANIQQLESQLQQANTDYEQYRKNLRRQFSALKNQITTDIRTSTILNQMSNFDSQEDIQEISKCFQILQRNMEIKVQHLEQEYQKKDQELGKQSLKILEELKQSSNHSTHVIYSASILSQVLESLLQEILYHKVSLNTIKLTNLDDSTKDKINEYRKKVGEFQIQQSECKLNLSQTEKLMQQLRDKIECSQERREQIEKELKDSQQKALQLEEKLIKANKQCNDQTIMIEEKEKLILQSSRIIEDLKTNVGKLSHNVDQQQIQIKFSEQQKLNFEQQLNESRQKLREKEKVIKNLEIENKEMQELMKNHTEQLWKQKQQVDELLESKLQLQEVQSSNILLEEKLQRIQQSLDQKIEDIRHLELNMGQLELEKENLVQRINEQNLIIQKGAQKIEELEGEKEKNLGIAKQSEKLIKDLTLKIENLSNEMQTKLDQMSENEFRAQEQIKQYETIEKDLLQKIEHQEIQISNLLKSEIDYRSELARIVSQNETQKQELYRLGVLTKEITEERQYLQKLGQERQKTIGDLKTKIDILEANKEQLEQQLRNFQKTETGLLGELKEKQILFDQRSQDLKLTRDRLDEKNSQIKLIEERNQELLNILDQKQKRISKLELESEQQKQQVSQLLNEQQQTKLLLQESNLKIQSMELNFESLDQQMTALEKERESKIENEKRLTKELEENYSLFLEQKQRYQEEIINFQKESTILKEKIKSLEDECEGQKQRLVQMEGLMKSISQDNELKVKTISQELEGSKCLIVNLNEKIKEQERCIQRKTEEFNSLSKVFTCKQDLILSLEDKILNYQKEHEQLVQQRTEEQKRYSLQLTNKQNQMLQFEEQILQYQSLNDELKGKDQELSKLVKDLKLLEEQNNKLKEQLDIEVGKQSRLNQEYEISKNKLMMEQEKYEEQSILMNKSINEYSAQNNQLSNQIEQLKTQVIDLQQSKIIDQEQLEKFKEEEIQQVQKFSTLQNEADELQKQLTMREQQLLILAQEKAQLETLIKDLSVEKEKASGQKEDIIKSLEEDLESTQQKNRQFQNMISSQKERIEQSLLLNEENQVKIEWMKAELNKTSDGLISAQSYCQVLDNLLQELLFNRVNLTTVKQVLTEQQRDQLNEYRKKVGEVQVLNLFHNQTKMLQAEKIKKQLDDCNFRLTQYQQLIDKSEMRTRHFETECQRLSEQVKELQSKPIMYAPTPPPKTPEIEESVSQEYESNYDIFLDFSLREEILWGDKSFFGDLSAIFPTRN